MTKTPINELDYDLKDESIAQYRYIDPSNSKLLIASSREIITFNEYIQNINTKSVFIFNKSSVQNVRIKTTRIKTGGKIEFFILNILDVRIGEVLIKSSKKIKPKDKIETEIGSVRILNKNKETYTVSFDVDIKLLIDNFGTVPLPPYINDNPSKYKDYINEFSQGGFSVAASTAGLHFSLNMISDLRKRGHQIIFINLDINLGTFKQIDTELLEDYKIHSENYEIEKKDYQKILDLKENGYKILAVGTTVLRTLETVANTKNYQGSTNLFITPGFKFKIVDALITNFHAPKSSLLSIVQTIFGKEWRNLYSYAQSKNLKFLSFGDAVLFNIDE